MNTMIQKSYIFLLSLFLCSIYTFGQDTTQILTSKQDSILDEIVKNSTVLELHIIDGDTIPMVVLPPVSLTARQFCSAEEERQYKLTRRRVVKVYPYAKKAAELMIEIEEETAFLGKKRYRKRYVKQLEDELKEQFEDKLRNLTVSEGKILMEIIERNTGKVMNDILKEYKNPVTATFWRTVSKRYGYDLKSGYNIENPEFEYLEEIVRALEANGGEAAKAFKTDDL